MFNILVQGGITMQPTIMQTPVGKATHYMYTAAGSHWRAVEKGPRADGATCFFGPLLFWHITLNSADSTHPQAADQHTACT